MNRLNLVVTIFFIFGCVNLQLPPAPPQETPLEMANKIIIHTTDSPLDAYRNLAQTFIQSNFSLNNTDDLLLIISTDWKEGKTFGGQIKINVFVKEESGHTQITIKGKWRGDNLTSDAGITIMDYGLKGSLAKTTFLELESAAKLYPNGKILYARD